MEFNTDQAIYLQIADHFCEHILLGKWKPGDRIPSVREMAVSIEVNPNTVMRTFNYLQEKDIIYNKRGIGYFVSDDGLQKTLALRKENFISHEVPRFFKEMRLLHLTMEDVNVYYKQFLSRLNEGSDVNTS
jgi:GntR family transcriptional regulator